MTINLALEYIPRRMRELGYDNHYSLRFRHYVLQPSEFLKIEAFNQMFLLVEESQDISISSELGVFDLSAESVNEMIYEHQGLIKVRNQSIAVKHIRFIQIIPDNK